MTCPSPEEMVEERINRVLTQYRESPKLLHVLRTYLGAVAEVHQRACDLPEYFHLDTAQGDQLTILGKRMGWPRCHCVCDSEPVFGFDCDDFSIRPITGFCDPSGSWVECSTGLSDICLTSDDLYRKFLMVRRYQYLNLYDLASLEECLRIFFGPEAGVMYSGQGRVVVTPGRDLISSELALLPLMVRVLPLALGIRVTFYFGPKRVFGFGEGWGGFMEPDPELTAQTDAYQRTQKMFGFCSDDDPTVGGFCENWTDEGLFIKTERLDPLQNVIPLVDENGNMLYTGPLKENAAWLCRSDAPWMCEIDVHPYDC